jgi:hypothetical protein
VTWILRVETLEEIAGSKQSVIGGRGSGGGDPSAGKERPPQDDKNILLDARKGEGYAEEG